MKLLTSKTFGLLLTIIAAIAIGSAVFAQLHGKNTAQTSDPAAFVESGIKAITGTWNPDAMIKRADPAILTPFVRQQLPQAYAQLSAKWGRLQHVAQPVGAPTSPYVVNGAVAGVVGSWTADAQFEHGPATVEMVIRRAGNGEWKILGLRIEPRKLTP